MRAYNAWKREIEKSSDESESSDGSYIEGIIRDYKQREKSHFKFCCIIL